MSAVVGCGSLCTKSAGREPGAKYCVVHVRARIPSSCEKRPTPAAEEITLLRPARQLPTAPSAGVV